MRTIALAAALSLTVCSAHAQKVIRVWHTETQPNSQEAVKNIARRFEARHPGVKVEVEVARAAGGSTRAETPAAASIGSGSLRIVAGMEPMLRPPAATREMTSIGVLAAPPSDRVSLLPWTPWPDGTRSAPS